MSPCISDGLQLGVQQKVTKQWDEQCDERKGKEKC